ncbi:Gamma-crystallin B-like [Arapaima gigas]
MTQAVHGSDQIKLFEKPNFEGTVMEVTENIPSTLDYFSNRAVHSCRVLDGAWVFFEHPNYRGRQYLLEKGDYSCYTEWGAMYPTVGSIRHITSY